MSTNYRVSGGKRAALFSIALFLLGLQSELVFSQSPDCKSCKGLTASQLQQSKSLKMHEELLKKNQDFLKGLHPEKDASKALKVKSNIFVIVLRIETFKNEIETLETKIQQSQCKNCVGL